MAVRWGGGGAQIYVHPSLDLRPFSAPPPHQSGGLLSPDQLVTMRLASVYVCARVCVLWAFFPQHRRHVINPGDTPRFPPCHLESFRQPLSVCVGVGELSRTPSEGGGGGH